VRVAWDIVSVVDPLFTLPLIGLVLTGVVRRQARFAAAGVCWAIFYLGVAVVQHQRAEDAAVALARERGHQVVRLAAMPAFGSLLLWRTIYEYDGRYFVDAVRTAAGIQIFPGRELPKLDIERDFPWLRAATQQAKDLERFRWFTNDYLAPDPARPGLVVDLRYSLVPNSTDAFWGIELDPTLPDAAHVRYVTMRNRSWAEGETLLKMLLTGRADGPTGNLR
jgi:inner membrane protein